MSAASANFIVIMVGLGVGIVLLILNGWTVRLVKSSLSAGQRPRPPPDAETVAYDGRANDALSMYNRAERERSALEVENGQLRRRVHDLQAQIPTVDYRSVFIDGSAAATATIARKPNP